MQSHVLVTYKQKVSMSALSYILNPKKPIVEGGGKFPKMERILYELKVTAKAIGKDLDQLVWENDKMLSNDALCAVANNILGTTNPGESVMVGWFDAFKARYMLRSIDARAKIRAVADDDGKQQDDDQQPAVPEDEEQFAGQGDYQEPDEDTNNELDEQDLEQDSFQNLDDHDTDLDDYHEFCEESDGTDAEQDGYQELDAQYTNREDRHDTEHERLWFAVQDLNEWHTHRQRIYYR